MKLTDNSDVMFRISYQHKYPDTGAWAKYNAQFKDSRKKRSIDGAAQKTSQDNDDLLHFLLKAVQVTEILDTALENVKEFTILSPKVDALKNASDVNLFDILDNKESLKNTVLRYVIPSKINPEDISSYFKIFQDVEPSNFTVDLEIKTIGGDTLKFVNDHAGTISVVSISNGESANIISADAFGRNGLILTLDNLI